MTGLSPAVAAGICRRGNDRRPSFAGEAERCKSDAAGRRCRHGKACHRAYPSAVRARTAAAALTLARLPRPDPGALRIDTGSPCPHAHESATSPGRAAQGRQAKATGDGAARARSRRPATECSGIPVQGHVGLWGALHPRLPGRVACRRGDARCARPALPGRTSWRIDPWILHARARNRPPLGARRPVRLARSDPPWHRTGADARRLPTCRPRRRPRVADPERPPCRGLLPQAGCRCRRPTGVGQHPRAPPAAAPVAPASTIGAATAAGVRSAAASRRPSVSGAPSRPSASVTSWPSATLQAM